MNSRLVHHLVYTSLSATRPVACEATFELAETRAREHLNGHAVLFVSGAREIYEGEEGASPSYVKNFACPICSRVKYKIRELPRLFHATIEGDPAPRFGRYGD